MPAAFEYKPDDKDLRKAAEEELVVRRTTQELALRYYQGRHKQQLKVRPGEPDDNVIINLVRQAVDRTCSFLASAFPALELDESRETDAERDLRLIWAKAGGARLLLKLAKHGALTGHVFARIYPAPEGSDQLPRVIALNPANVLAFWQGDDYERVLWYEVHWNVGKARYRQDVVRQDAGWLVRDFEGNDAGDQWVSRGQAVWPFEAGPIVDWQHNLDAAQFYGTGEADNIALNDKVNKIASDISRILRFHASPRTVGTGFQAEDVTATAIDNFWTIDNPEAKVYNVEMESDLASSMAFLEFVQRAYLAERRVVTLKGDVADFQRVTNLGMRALFIDALAKNAELQGNYELGIIGVSRALLALQGAAYEGDITVHWPDPLPVDPLEVVTVLEKERAMGTVSKETVARDRGRDWALEQQRMDGESDGEMQVVEKLLR